MSDQTDPLLSALDDIQRELELVNRSIALDIAPSAGALLSALRAVLELHRPVGGGTPTGDAATVCACGMSYWPCPTVTALKEVFSEQV